MQALQETSNAKLVSRSRQKKYELMRLKQQLDQAQAERQLTVIEQAFSDLYEMLQGDGELP